MLHCIILILSILHATSAWFTPKHVDSSLSQSAAIGDDNEIQLLLDSMQRGVNLPSDSRTSPEPSNPSCFSLALSSLSTTTPCETLSKSDSNRIQVATSMAVCEIRTAGDHAGRVPKECLDWERGRGQVSDCVEALSRSPQHWSSYSGYLREVVTLCSAYRRWADLEHAKSIHAATSLKFSDFLDSLKSYEVARAARADRAEVERLIVVKDLTLLSRTLSDLSTSLEADQGQRLKDSSAVQHILFDTIRKVEIALEESTREGVASMVENMKSAMIQLTEETSFSLNGIASEHSNSLAVASSDLQTHLSSIAGDLQLSVGSISGEFDTFRVVTAETNREMDVVLGTSESLSVSLAQNLDLVERQKQASEDVDLDNTRRSHELRELLVMLNSTLRARFARKSLLDGFGSFFGAYADRFTVQGLFWTRFNLLAMIYRPTPYGLMKTIAVLSTCFPILWGIIKVLFRFSRWTIRSKPKYISENLETKHGQLELYRPSATASPRLALMNQSDSNTLPVRIRRAERMSSRLLRN